MDSDRHSESQLSKKTKSKPQLSHKSLFTSEQRQKSNNMGGAYTKAAEKKQGWYPAQRQSCSVDNPLRVLPSYITYSSEK